MTTFEKARALADAGCAVFPCHGSDKSPACAGGFKAATTAPTADWWGSAALIGMPTGPVSGFDVLDIDPRHGGDEWLSTHADRLPATRTQVTRSGGRHLYFKALRGMRNSAGKLAPGVDVRAEGGYVIRWDAEGLKTRHPDVVAEWPVWLVNELLKEREQAAALTAADLAPPSIAAAVGLLNAMPNPDTLGRDQWVAIGLAAAGCQQGAEAVGMDDEGAIREAWLAWSAKWIGADPDADETRWDDDFSTRTRALAGWRQLLGHATALGVDIQPFTAVEAEADFAHIEASDAAYADADPSAWRSMLAVTDKGVPRAVLMNAMVAFRHAPEWRGVLGFNTFSLRVTFLKAPPWQAGDFEPRALEDVDCTDAAYWLQTRGIMVSSAMAAEAMASVSRARSYHPVRDYLAGLTWDGKPRIDTWLVDHLGAEDTPLNRAFAAKFLISAVARISNRDPKKGVKVDAVLMLEGPQGVGKSSTGRILAGAEAFADTMPDLSNKDALIQLQGRWIIEQAEMDRLRGAEASRVKAFITSEVDVFRPPYGRAAAEFPRQCVFIATVNPGANGTLMDETGARRFWPVLCGATWAPGRVLNTAALAAARDQLWAEARDRCKAGEAWWLDTPELIAAHKEATERRFERDPWHDIVAAIVDGAGAKGITIAGIMDHAALNIASKDQSRTHAIRVARILTALGCQEFRGPRTANPARTRLYRMPDAGTRPPVSSDAKVVPLLSKLLEG